MWQALWGETTIEMAKFAGKFTLKYNKLNEGKKNLF